MAGFKSFFWASSLLPLASAVPWSSKRQTDSSNNNTACAYLSEVYEAASIRGLPNVQPSEAYACLRSIPVDTDRNDALLTWIAPWMEFQSTVGILADPPAGYMYPGVDILGGLRNMSSMLQNDEYESQYDFVLDLYRLINVKPREGHLSYQPALINAVQFETPIIFISISEDGIQLPEVYVYQDYLASITARFEPSAVESYDGVPVEQWLEQRAVDNAPSQDPDACYNAQVWSAALDNIGVTRRAYRFTHGHLNDTSELVFKNGTERTVQNYAILQGDWSDISSPLDVHRRFEIPGRDGSPQSDPVAEGRGNEDDLPDLIGYPDPLFRHEDNYMSAYLFEDDGSKLANTAVIAVKSFVSTDPDVDLERDMMVFANVTNAFVAASKQAGTEKLIIDFQGNGGGTLGNLIGLYNVLFPDRDLHLHMRARANDVLEWIGSTSERAGVDTREFFPFDPADQVDADFELFSRWSDYYDTEEILGDEFTQIFQPILMVGLSILPETFGMALHDPYFDPNNTVIVTDGYCASACAMAVGLMARLLGVNTVAMGGRPIEAPMQAIGGTKGGPVMSLAQAQQVVNSVGSASRPPRSLDVTPFISNAPLAGPPASSFVINTANVHRHDNLGGTPAQFAYEAANCKLFYTWDTLTNMTRLWEAVADVEWNGARCVAGSTANDDDTMSNSVREFSQDVVSNLTWIEGPGDISDRPPTGEVEETSGGGGGGGGGNGGTSNDDDSAASALGASMASLVTLAAAVAVFL